jgi:hypothetical protein
VEVPLAAGRQNDEDPATGISRIDAQFWHLYARFKGRGTMAQPATSSIKHVRYVYRDMIHMAGREQELGLRFRWLTLNTYYYMLLRFSD